MEKHPDLKRWFERDTMNYWQSQYVYGGRFFVSSEVFDGDTDVGTDRPARRGRRRGPSCHWLANHALIAGRLRLDASTWAAFALGSSVGPDRTRSNLIRVKASGCSTHVADSDRGAHVRDVALGENEGDVEVVGIGEVELRVEADAEIPLWAARTLVDELGELLGEAEWLMHVTCHAERHVGDVHFQHISSLPPESP